MTIKIILAEDHELTRKGIAYGLKFFKEIEVISEASNGQEALEQAREKMPDVILMDIAMPVMNGINATRRIHEMNENIKVIMLTSLKEKETVLSAFSSGANGYCMKDVKSEELAEIIKIVMTGALWIAPSIAAYILDFLHSEYTFKENVKSENIFNLTTREKEILKLISKGLCNKDIAEELIISLHTVKNHVKNIIQKLAVEDRTQAAILALKQNLI